MPENEEWKKQYDAPAGMLFICTVCGRTDTNRVDVGTEACFINAILIPKESYGEWRIKISLPLPEGIKEAE